MLNIKKYENDVIQLSQAHIPPDVLDRLPTRLRLTGLSTPWLCLDPTERFFERDNGVIPSFSCSGSDVSSSYKYQEKFKIILLEYSNQYNGSLNVIIKRWWFVN